MIDEFLKFLEIKKFVLAVPIVYLLEIGSDFLAVVKETHFDEIEQKKEIELLTLFESDLILVVDRHYAVNILKLPVAVMFKLTDSAKSS